MFSLDVFAYLMGEDTGLLVSPSAVNTDGMYGFWGCIYNCFKSMANVICKNSCYAVSSPGTERSAASAAHEAGILGLA